MSDTDLIGCSPCKGRGKLLGLGSIMQDCDSCKGIGWVETPSAKIEPELIDPPKKKSGRPKKEKVA